MLDKLLDMYVADGFKGNANGKGAAFSLFEIVGIPFPPPAPFSTFIQWFGTEVVAIDGAKSNSIRKGRMWLLLGRRMMVLEVKDSTS